MTKFQQQKRAVLSVSPSGILHVVYHADDQHSTTIIKQDNILKAFANSPEEGLFALVTSNSEHDLPLAITYWRQFIALYIEQLSQHGGEPIHQPAEELLNQWIHEFRTFPKMH